MTLVAARGSVAPSTIGRGIAVSMLAHALAVAGVVAVARGRPVPLAPTTYRVTLVAAPPSSPTTAAASTPPAAPAPITRANADVATEQQALVAPAIKSHVPMTLAPTRATPVKAAPVKAKPTLAKPTLAKPTLAKPAATKPASAKPVAATPVRPTRTPVKPTATAAHAASGTTRIPVKSAPTPPTATRDKIAAAAAGTPAARGHDVADVRVVGLEFPFPGYLDNLVRQVRVRFAPTPSRAPLHADLAFVVARDGSITGLRVVRSSGDYAFDLEAQGAVEAAGSARAFGPLPDGFHGSTLPVTFSFDPRSAP